MTDDPSSPAANPCRAFDVLPLGAHFYRLEPDGRLIFEGGNRAADRILGFDHRILIGKTIEEAFPAHQISEIPNHYRHIVLTGEAWHTEHYIYEDARIAGAFEVWAFRTGPGRMAALFADITERTRRALDIQHSEESIREQFENASDMIYTNDMKGRIITFNQAAQRITGYSLEEIRDMRIGDIIAPGQHALAVRMMERKLAGEPVTAYETEWLTRDGRRIPVEISTRLIFDKGEPVGLQGIARDITDRRQLQEQLIQAQKMEAIGRFAGGIAHDFNNILTVVLGYADWIKMTLPPGSLSYNHAEQISAAALRASALTRQLLAFARKQIADPRLLRLNDMIANMDGMLRRLIGEDVSLKISLAPDLWSVRMDATHVDQILMNMASNARDAMPRGGRLTIETANIVLDESYTDHHEGAVPGPYVLLTVTDTGVGMSGEVRARIFEPLFTTKPAGQGTGMGLSICYGIVKQAGGHIRVYSEPGQGTAFKIYLPRAEEGTGSQGVPPESQEIPRGTETILIAEDEESVRQMAARTLEAQGYRVLTAPDGESALAVTEPVDLLISDVVMPRMSGPDLARAMLERSPALKILYISGYTANGLSHNGLPFEGIYLLTKPFTPAHLARKTREVLDAKDFG